MPRAPQADKFVECLVKAMVTGNVPFNFIENKHFIEACGCVGITLPTRRQLSNTLIPKLAQQANVSNKATLADALLVDASSDGWKSSNCENGAALNNIVALVFDRAYFHDAINCSDMRKDASAIANFLLNAAADLVGSTDEDLERLAGWILDNTKANWKAMLRLQEDHPKWILRGCFAHGQNLLMKDFCKYKAATGPRAFARTFGMRWAQQQVEDANTIANFIQDSGQARNLVCFCLACL